MQAVLKAQINKTDRNDARGIAQMMWAGLYRPVHVKTIGSQKLRMLLTHRKLLQSKAIAIENDLHGTLRNFGLTVGMVGKVKFEAREARRREGLNWSLTRASYGVEVCAFFVTLQNFSSRALIKGEFFRYV